MPEVCDPLARLRAAATGRAAAGLGRVLRPRQLGPDPVADLASNDYLGLAMHPEVIEGAVSAAGAQGGAVLGASEVIGTLVDTGRGFIFDTALAPPAAGAALAALRLLAAHPDMARQARDNARRLAATAEQFGLAVAPAGAAVVRIVLGEPGLAVAAQRICADHGVRAGCFRPPSVPREQSCLRLTARASLSEADFVAATQALAAVRDHVRTAAPVGRK